MRHLFSLILILVLPLISSSATTKSGLYSATAQLTPGYLRTEYRVNPAGIDVRIPRLSWVLRSDENGQRQTAYRVLVASSPERLAADKGNLWDSGKVPSEETIQVEYGGTTLRSRMKAWWKVMVWDRDGKPSGWSDTATWSMGLLEESDWSASWIADKGFSDAGGPVKPRNGYHSLITHTTYQEYQVVIDLGKEQVFQSIRLWPARPFDYKDTPGFLFPLRFRLETSNRMDFRDARTLSDNTTDDVPNPGDTPRTYGFPESKGRFVRLTVIKLALRDGDNYAFALNEMEVLGNGRNLALNAKVMAPDAIEGENWKPEFLTDGQLHTPKSGEALPATYARKSFTLPGKVKSATAYVSALGLYEFRLNGQKVGDRLLAPEWTAYDRRVSYQAYDVTNLLRAGENAAGAVIGEGWFAGQLMIVGRFAYGNSLKFIAQLEMELEDGTHRTLVTDESWLTTQLGPITSSGIYAGESYDARLEKPGWDLPGFADTAWKPALAAASGTRRLVWLPNEPIGVELVLVPKKITEPAPGTYIIDFGQNMVGWARLSGKGLAGRAVKLRYGEALLENGMLYTENLRKALQTDTYIPGKDGDFTFEPRFTYHGFQYVEITGLAEKPAPEHVTGMVFHSSSPMSGTFDCSDPSLNRLMENIRWTERANLMSSPNDCPQRDERFGWMGDIQAFAQTGIFNMDLAAFITKFAQDTRDDQSDDGRFPDYAPHPGDRNGTFSGAPAWGDAGVFVPWTAWVNYADRRLLDAHFDAARRWVDYIHRNNPDLIWRNGRNNDYNDWLNGDRIIYEGWPKKGGEVPNELFATAFFARSAQIVAAMATATGRIQEAAVYTELADQIKQAFNREFVSPDGHLKGDTQAGYALALSFNLLPDNLKPETLQLLIDNINGTYKGHLSTGIQTTHRAMLELSRGGRSDMAYKLLMNRSFPSWMYMIDNGATTIWERWDGYVKGRGFQDPGMNSMNHWAFGAVGEWVWRTVTGLNPDESQPGWKHFTIAPVPGGGLTRASGEYNSIRGLISSSWEIRDGKFSLDVTVPPGCTATVRLPGTGTSRDTLAISGTHRYVIDYKSNK